MKYNTGDWRLVEHSFLDSHWSIDMIKNESGGRHFSVANIVVKMDGAEEVDEEFVGNARLMTAAKDMYEALAEVNKIIAEASATGFNHNSGDWAERLFHSQQASSRALKKVRGN